LHFLPLEIEMSKLQHYKWLEKNNLNAVNKEQFRMAKMDVHDHLDVEKRQLKIKKMRKELKEIICFFWIRSNQEFVCLMQLSDLFIFHSNYYGSLKIRKIICLKTYFIFSKVNRLSKFNDKLFQTDIVNQMEYF